MSCFANSTSRACMLAGLTALLAACGSVMDTDKVNYKSETEDKAVPLEVPPDLTKMSRSKRYEMPGGSISAKSMMNESNAGTDTDASSTSPLKLADIQVKREGSQMWLQVGRAPDVLWPQIKEFWKDSGFTLVKEEQAVGLMETDWAENRAKLPQDFVRRNLGKLLDSLYSTGERDKFRIRLERTSDNQTEVFITHRGLIESGGGGRNASIITWQPRPNDPELEKEFMRRLMVKLAPADAKTATVTDLNLALPPVSSVSEFVNVDGKPTVSFKQSFDVAWRRVGQALDRNGFTVEDRDRSQGLYFVRYVETPSEEEQGFFSKLFSKSKPPPSPQQYRLKITSTNSQTSTIAILNASGEPDGSDTATRIAKLLVNELK